MVYIKYNNTYYSKSGGWSLVLTVDCCYKNPSIANAIAKIYPGAVVKTIE